MAYSPLGRGLLTASAEARDPSAPFRGMDPRFTGDALTANAAAAARLAALAHELHATPTQVALAWLVAQGDHVVPIPGSRRAARTVENAAATRVHLDDANLRELDAISAQFVGDRASFAAPHTQRAR